MYYQYILAKQQLKEVLITPFKCTKDHNLISLQIKNLHRYYPCQKLVSKWDSDTSSVCKFCKETESDIIHTFVTCSLVKPFWTEIETLLNSTNLEKRIQLNTNSILFGLTPYTIQSHSINHCIIHGKYFIHKEIQNDRIPSIENFIKYYKHILNTEREYFIERD